MFETEYAWVEKFGKLVEINGQVLEIKLGFLHMKDLLCAPVAKKELFKLAFHDDRLFTVLLLIEPYLVFQNAEVSFLSKVVLDLGIGLTLGSAGALNDVDVDDGG